MLTYADVSMRQHASAYVRAARYIHSICLYVDIYYVSSVYVDIYYVSSAILPLHVSHS
jgi:hypothetical protein